MKEKKETVEHPDHYNFSKYETIDVIEGWKLGFSLGNVIKYISRAGRKIDEIEDLKKARFYLNYFIFEKDNLENLPPEEVINEWKVNEELSKVIYLVNMINKSEKGGTDTSPFLHECLNTINHIIAKKENSSTEEK